MSKKILTKIAAITPFQDDFLLECYFPELTDKMYLRDKSITSIKQGLNGQLIQIENAPFTIRCSAENIEVISSIADFKNVFFKVSLKKEAVTILQDATFIITI